MDKIVIEGGHRLEGTVQVSGSKNAALPLLFATLLAEGDSVLSNVPDLQDITSTCQLLNHLGLATHRSADRLYVKNSPLKCTEAPYNLVRKMRASILALGPLLAKTGQARVSLPGGCAIGARPVNLHIDALKKMGAQITIEEGYIQAKAAHLHGAEIHFETVTVTGTENIMMAATLADGETILHNAAREPEIVDLAQGLREMGALIAGDGTPTIKILGVSSLRGLEHTVIPDRVEAATHLMAAALCRGRVTVDGVIPIQLDSLLAKLREAGAKTLCAAQSVQIEGPDRLLATNIQTAPYPGFATDYQAQFMACMCVAEGKSIIEETIFENRFMHASELMRMGARIEIQGNTAHVNGIPKLSPAPIMASDLRASAALILAGLVADGVTEIHRVYHIDRGYENIEKKLRKIGARIKRVPVKF